jgi:hypothetical protein
MLRARSLAPWLLLAALPLAACGVQGQIRPYVVAVWPADLQTVAGPVQEVRVTWDEPVSILNPSDLHVFHGGVLLATRLEQRAGEPRSVYAVPTDGSAFPAGTDLAVEVVQGTVVNALRHYADGVFVSHFSTAPVPEVPVGRPGQVTLFDLDTLAPTTSVPTPAGTNPVGIVSTLRDGQPRRIWVQLDNGGGSGAALAYFEPGDAAMTTVSLSTSGGDLLASATALGVAPDGRWIYGAWRDDASGGVRLVRVDAATATEDAFLDLASVPTGASTWPADLELGGTSASDLLVTAADGAGGTLARVDRTTWTEVDADAGAAGIQGVDLGTGAGPLAAGSADRVLVAPAGTADATLVAADGSVSTLPSTVPGTSVALVGSPDTALVVHALATFSGTDALQLRTSAAGYDDPTALAVSDDVGGMAAGITDAVALRWIDGNARVLGLFDSPGGLVLALWTAAGATLTQVDLDAVAAGVQAADVSGTIPDATVVGRTYGTFAP